MSVRPNPSPMVSKGVDLGTLALEDGVVLGLIQGDSKGSKSASVSKTRSYVKFVRHLGSRFE